MSPKWQIVAVVLFTSALLSLRSSSASAQRPEEALLIDGISTIITSSSPDASTVTPILRSDVELIRHLLLLDRYGPDWREHVAHNVEVERLRARRFAVLVRLLAASPIASNEDPDHAYRNEVVLNLEQRSGGSRSFRRMLAQCGVDEADLRNWISQMMVARSQLQLIYDRAGVSMPLRLADSPSETSDTDSRNTEIDRKMKDALADWLSAILGRGDIHFADVAKE